MSHFGRCRPLAQIEKRLETASEEGQLQWADLGERMGEFSRLIEAGRADSGKVRGEVAERLKGIETRLSAEPGEPGTVTREFAERIAGLERAVRAGFGDAAQTNSNLVERLQLVERGLTERPRDDGEALLILDDRLGSIERMLDTRGQQAASSSAEIVERLRILEQRPAAQGTVDVAGLVSPLTTQFQSLEGNNASRAEALHTSLTDINVRLAALEERMRAEALVTEEALRGRDQDFDFIYNEIKQLGQSQATLNSAVNDWRNDSQTHFGTLAGRLDKLQIAPPMATAAVETGTVPSVPFELPTVVKGRNGAEPIANAANRTGAGPDRSLKNRLDQATVESGKAGSEDIRADDYALPPQPGRGFWYWLFPASVTSVEVADR